MLHVSSPLLQLHTADFLPPGADTAPRRNPGGAGASLHWLAHHVVNEHLVFIGWIESRNPGVAIAVVDGQMRLRATHFRPDGQPEEAAPRLRRIFLPHSAHSHVLQQDGGSLHAVVALEQRGHRAYRYGPAEDHTRGGLGLEAPITTWFRLRVDFADPSAGDIRIGLELIRNEPFLGTASHVQAGEQRYWLAEQKHLHDGDSWNGIDPVDTLVQRKLVVAQARDGLPDCWLAMESAGEVQPAQTEDWLPALAAPQPYDATHAVMLAQSQNRTALCLLDLANAKVEQAAVVRIARGYWRVKAWNPRTDTAGGSLWLWTSNNKLSAKHRDSTLWRIDYGNAVKKPRGKIDGLPMKIERLDEDREITGSTIINFDDFTLAMWNRGHGIKHVDPMRCRAYRHDDAAQPMDVSYLEPGLPFAPAGVTRHFDKDVEYPSVARVPELGFDFAGRRLLAYTQKENTGFPTGYFFVQVDGRP